MKKKAMSAIVTGGTRGLGAAITSHLIEIGFRVCTISRGPSDARLMSQFPDRYLHVAGNVADESIVDAAISEVIGRWGRIDLLVNNAGVTRIGPVETISGKVFRTVMDTNLMAPFILCQKAIPEMISQGFGRIVNIASFYGIYHVSGGSAYCASKSGLIALSEALDKELRGTGVRVLAFCPVEIVSTPELRDPKKRNFVISEDQVLEALDRVIGTDTAHSVISLVTPKDFLHKVIQDFRLYVAMLRELGRWLIIQKRKS